ncbi:trypsin delta-like [Schistocerca americana]|uniref:trypsin delta-like n=1 Tax=Schistocerca americana TaxID=7009 RepID=UPI001F4F21FB|nr:trypsin delta-like [Schistocerca americana]
MAKLVTGYGYDPPGGLKVTFTGWGTTISTGQAAPNTLMKVDITVIDRANCVASFDVNDRMICAGENGKSTCNGGDFGGPLVSGSIQCHVTASSAAGDAVKAAPPDETPLKDTTHATTTTTTTTTTNTVVVPEVSVPDVGLVL